MTIQEHDSNLITRGTLWQRLCASHDRALASGDLKRFATESVVLEERGIPFIVRVALNLQRKREESQNSASRDPGFNPFLPPEPPLTVGAIGTEHLAVLNKFNVVDHHLLIVTRRFEEQESLLTAGDMQALCFALAEVDGLGFYNGGSVAGASQRHKHLQLIPIHGLNNSAQLPIEAVLPDELGVAITRLDTLPFPHLIAALGEGLFDDIAQAADRCHALYLAMLQRLGCVANERDTKQGRPYNLLLTRRWLMVVPRTREKSHDISVNAMGFAGSLFVMDEAGLERIRRLGPCRLLAEVTSQ